MESTEVPDKFPIPFAANAGSGFIRDIPTDSSSTLGAASLYDGFPPACFAPPSAGGVPPSGQDFNGVLYRVTAWARWLQAGGFPAFDSDYSSAIGGYPLRAALISADGTHFWRSTIENNTNNPDTGGAGWTVLQPGTYPWGSITGAPSFMLASDFTAALVSAFSGHLLSPSGYQPLPGGFILQWGTYTAASNDIAYTVALPESFPNAHLVAFASVKWSGNFGGSLSAYATPGSNSTVVLTGDCAADGASNIPITYFSIGK